MKIIYVSSLCSEERYNLLFHEDKYKTNQQIQKYHRLLVEGFVANNIAVKAITSLPLNREITKKVWVIVKKEEIGLIQYHYLFTINIPLIRNIWTFLHSFFIILFTKRKDDILICDALNIFVAFGALLASKILGLKSVGIVTDLPSMLGNNKFIEKINNFIIKFFDSYIFLTQQMNELINNKKKPYRVIEGHVNINMKNVENKLVDKYSKKVCLYAGRLDKKYGIEVLTEAFAHLKYIEDVELHLYGKGDFELELGDICKKNKNIIYFGIKPNSYIINEQLKATLLINPRLTTAEYTKYSFPSKNMEYMVSGTPLLTTVLPGMPEEYDQYVYLIKDESVEGLTNIIKEIISKDKQELHSKGLRAKEFVLNKKNNVLQAKVIINMCNDL